MTEETLFHEALLKPGSERAAFLDEACAGKPELRAAVEALLAAHEASGHFLGASNGGTVAFDSNVDKPSSEATIALTPRPEGPLPQFPATADYNASPKLDRLVAGRYALEQKIGEGGMGEVWVAKQTEPVKRKVALKLIKTGMDSKAVIQRFEQERQALAMMDHPNIAKVLDAGLTPTGQPFFVMELVNGLALNKFSDEARLPTKDRLELFVAVCQAVQHAHQKGIVHRDLKPANILVTIVDGKPVPKVIDFGVAKATGGKLTDDSMSTQFGSIVGTLEYMSPEQAAFSGVDIDTRADIYSLGVILYELLTGLRPIDATRLKKAAMTEMIRIISEEEPSKPSTRLSTDQSLPSTAALRQIEPSKLMALLRGELDWVVMKCLEKHRERRYETANALARDVQRYLDDEAVEARPPSAGYRVSKFLKRNKGPVMAAAVVAATLLAGIIGTTWGMIRAEAARDTAAQRAEGERLAKKDALAAAEAEKKAKLQAQNRLSQVEKSSDLLASVFTDLDPQAEEKEGKPLRVILGNRLAQAAAQLEGESVGDPLLVAGLQSRLGDSLSNLGMTERAIPLFEKVRNTRTTILGAEHLHTLATMSRLALAYKDVGNLEQALPLYEKTLELFKAKRGLSDKDTINCMNNLAIGYQEVGRLHLALPLFEEAYRLRRESLGADHPDTVVVMNNLALAYQAAGKLDKAVQLLEEAAQLMKDNKGSDHASTLTTTNNLALVYQAAGKQDQALPLFEKTFEKQKAKLGAIHPDTLITMGNLAACYQESGQGRMALPLLEETLELMKAARGPAHQDTLLCMNNLAIGYESAGKLDLALPLFLKTLEVQKSKLGVNHSATLQTMNNLGNAYSARGDSERALPLLEETLKLRKSNLSADHPDTLESMASLAVHYKNTGKLDLALPLYEQTFELRKAKLGSFHRNTLKSMNNLALGYLSAGKLDKALPLLEELLRLRRFALGPDHPDTFNSMVCLAAGYIAANKVDQAIPLYEDAFKLHKDKLGSDHPSTLHSMAGLASGYRTAGKMDKAMPLLKEVLELRKAKLGADHPDTLTSINNLAAALHFMGKREQALPLYLEAAAGVEKQRFQHENAGRIVNNLIECLEELGRFDQAEAWRRKSLKEITALFGADSAPYAAELASLGLNLLRQNKWSEAEIVTRECLELREKHAAEDWRTFNTKSMLGAALMGQKKYNESEPMLIAGYDGMKKREATMPPQAKERLKEALERLVQYYEAVGKPDEAANWSKLMEPDAAKQKTPENRP